MARVGEHIDLKENPFGVRIMYVDAPEELKQHEKRWKVHGIPTEWRDGELYVNVPDSITLIYKLDPMQLEIQLSFL